MKVSHPSPGGESSKSSDRELLELAAKAAGVRLMWSTMGGISPRSIDSGNTWNPLTDDGDALRLAVKLCMQVECSRGHQHVSVYGRDFKISECHDGINPEAATRRAIVRAAVELGASS